MHALFKLVGNSIPASNFEPRYNIAPMQKQFVVRHDEAGKNELVEMRWGLVPFWSKDDKAGAKCINARAETVADKPAYRAAFKARPCLIAADGFYEWAQIGPKEKQPYHFTTKDRAPFAFAGLWESWKPKGSEDKPLETYTIVTGEPNVLTGDIHDRMPVMLDPDQWDAWLGTPDQRKDMMKPYPHDKMAKWPVTKAVGNVRNQGPELVEPIAL